MPIDDPPDPGAAFVRRLVSRLRLRQLALLLAIERLRTLSRVASEMRLSQPAISKALREVEDTFAAPLFERTRQGLQPTPAGEAVLTYARRWFAELEATAHVLSSLEGGHAGRLRIGVAHGIPQALLQGALVHLLDRKSRVSVMTREGTTDDLVRGLMARELDCALGRAFDGEATGLVQHPVHEQEACLVMAAGSARRLARGRLTLASLAPFDWIMPPANTPMRRTYNAMFIAAGLQPPRPILESLSGRSVETVLRLEPNAIAVLARDVAAEMTTSGQCAVLPYRLSLSLPPVCFFTTADLASHPIVRSLRGAVVDSARSMQKAAGTAR